MFTKKFKVIRQPFPHVLIKTNKELHGWYRGKRECTAERMLINPYNGCSVGCFYCYARALPGYFGIFNQKNIVFVCKDFDKLISRQLDALNIASCGYLSPVTDPFQILEETYHLSERIIEEFIKRNIPIEFITKCKVPERVIDLIRTQKHSFGQISILTTKENLRKILAPGGADTIELFDNLKRLSKKGIFSVCRIDPIFPFITDEKKELSKVIERAIDAGARHIVASILDIPLRIKNFVFYKIKKHFGSGISVEYNSLYKEKIGYLNAKIDYRRKIFEFLRGFCDKKKVTFSLCMEYELKDNKIQGLNQEFMSSKNCEGIDIPLYVKKDKNFEVLYDCSGNCLNCNRPLCGIKDLAMARSPDTRKDFKLRDYRRWSREF
ncbi:MAG: hypothetical protein NC818_03995 [Candidatus Omnitrophica bacterium]|nr:hypothetical protein [Candidatus Omnitrophota bacterium]